jgi:hypothetical protein
MKKITFILLLVSNFTNAQINFESGDIFLSNDKKLIRMAVDSSLCIVRQDYNLKDKKGDEYGRDGKGYFGRKYTLGIISENKIWTENSINTPWDSDKYFELYKKNDTINTQLSDVAFRRIFNHEYILNTQKSESYDSSGVVTFKTNFKESVNLSKGNKGKNGWLVIVHSKEDLNKNEKSLIDYTIYNPSPQFQVNSMEGLIKKMPVKENIIGGIYFTTVIKLGEIKFQAAGVLKNKGNEWYILAFPQNEIVNDNLLTPIKNSKKDVPKASEEVKEKSKRDDKKKESKKSEF